ncbi:MAG: hypothetical protein AAGJ97_13885, partial [Planctomycetota bacterium]
MSFASLSRGSAVVMLAAATAATAFAGRPQAVTRPGYDADARTVEMFAGIEDGSLDVRLVMRDETAGNLFVNNLT